ncbi:MAG: OmpA family protein [Gammaproteobacteria bacterium]|nr:OmpA family protein [Gammaproteobacteria bacterium]
MIKTWFSLIIALALIPLSYAQDPRSTLFEAADEALESAQSANAPLLAPRGYSNGLEAYSDAANDLVRGRNTDRIQNRLADAIRSLNDAAVAARAARITLNTLIESRDDALNVRADNFATALWTDAEEAFNSSSLALEAGDNDIAQARAETAEILFRDAELTAIKAQYLSQTRALLAQAVQDRVPQNSPITYQKAQELLTQAEQAINENRYEMERPLRLVEQANYEARHAAFITEKIRSLRDGNGTAEDIILAHEEQIMQLASATDSVVQLDAGTETVTLELITNIENSHQREIQLISDLENSRRQIASLENEIRELDNQLNNASEEHILLVQRLEIEEQLRARFTRIETMFSLEEAQITREGSSVVVRLVGLTFGSGESNIRPEHGQLLDKLYDAIDTFPRSRVVVEGHTDSYGGSQANLRLSRSRAEAVGDYLNTQLGLESFRVSSVGYGQMRPIANNETSQGRARNRRIDIRIETQQE